VNEWLGHGLHFHICGKQWLAETGNVPI